MIKVYYYEHEILDVNYLFILIQLDRRYPKQEFRPKSCNEIFIMEHEIIKFVWRAIRTADSFNTLC